MEEMKFGDVLIGWLREKLTSKECMDVEYNHISRRLLNICPAGARKAIQKHPYMSECQSWLILNQT